MQDSSRRSIIRPGTALYNALQWAFFPMVLVLTPWLIYRLINNGGSVAITTYVVAVAVGLIFWLAEWLIPFKEKWNHSHDDIGFYRFSSSRCL